ncbi:sensor histidine kinase [Methanobacterium alcaliphilum]|uniref:sensor histidine kinase n=1 Tax=Methanobacterium alcaliphilum TaxID=392018 RepID=UPI002009EFDD|nr:sensor histidine kinase [Methanobacterium alcaliphilum]MCK9151859.1 sensor histidine kinase [Methanobacterium alcaliphilum]
MGVKATKKSLRPISTILFSILLLLSAALFLVSNNSQLFLYLSDFSAVFLNLAATLALTYAAYWAFKNHRKNYKAWVILSIGQFSFLLADIIYLFEDVFLNMPTYPSIADIFFLSFYPLFIIGLLLMFRPIKINLKISIDVLVTLSSAFLIFYFFVFAPTIQLNNGDVITALLSVSYLFLDIFLLTVIVSLLMSKNKFQMQTRLFFFSCAMFFQIFADLFFAAHISTVSSMDYWFSTVLYLTTYVFIMLAAISFFREVYVDSQYLILYKSIKKQHNLISYFPLFLVIFTYGLLLYSKTPSIPLLWGVGVIVVLVVIRQLISIYEIKKAEESLKKSLNEKEIMLKEIHHRVKNNLQIVSSLISLQSNNVSSEEDLELFKKSRDRIKSMSMIHENLYQSDNLAQINFNNYLQTMTQQLLVSYDLHGKLDYNLDCDDVYLGIETAIPCGLLVNEIISNSMKHAFPEGESGLITVQLKSLPDKYQLIISDNGVGLPENLDLKNCNSLGLQLVQNLSKQINGELDIKNNQGTQFKIEFNELEYKERF